MHSFYNSQICPFKGLYCFRAHIELSHPSLPPPAPPPPPIPLVQTGSNAPPKIKYVRVINTTRQLISPHCLSSHPCRSSNSCRPPIPPRPPPLFPPLSLLQTSHLKSKSARVMNTTTQLIPPHYIYSYPCCSSNSPPPPPPQRPLLLHHPHQSLDLAPRV